jgi:hypothetical protein
MHFLPCACRSSASSVLNTTFTKGRTRANYTLAQVNTYAHAASASMTLHS